MGNVTKQASTRFSIVKRSKGHSAVEKASYISRSVLECEYDGQTYRPKYHEDLVHSEISLSENAPKEFADRATLGNSVELSEKGQKAQLTRMGRLALPVVSAKYLAKIPNRERVQDIGNAQDFLERNGITTFAELKKFVADRGREFDSREQIFLSKWQRLEQLKALAKAYAEYEPYKKIHDESKSLSGLKKIRYDREHEKGLVQYDMARAELKSLLSEGEKITPKAWRTEREQLEREMPELRSGRARACHDLAFAEVIGYNRANLEQIEQNES